MTRLFSILGLLSSVFCLAARAGEPVELAADLGYLRVDSVVLEREALAAALLKSRALVLDLRYPADERNAGETLRQELDRQAARPRLYVLVSPATPVPVVGAIASSPARIITLGVQGSRPEPQVVVLQTAEDDRRAYEAFATGQPLAGLISGQIAKERYDEASLVQEFRSGNPDPQPPAAPGLSTTPDQEKNRPGRLTDRVLQRALHLHRALQALRR